ncbi:MAG: transporter substrate-binding domain-containing protein [Desulfobacteraceae bacterium]|nr:transporter substrate-binding domain-containing protein [Desulfobacteraceae bacterium]
MNFLQPNPAPDKNKANIKDRIPNISKTILVLLAILIGYTTVAFATPGEKSLTVACYKDYRPYSYINQKGEIVGVLIDFWTLWGKKNHVKLTFIPGHLTQSLERIKKGEADMMIGLFHSKDREIFMAFSDPMMEIHTNLYVRQNMGIDSIAGLNERKIPVGVIKDDYVISYLNNNHPNVKIKTFAGSEEVVKNALTGKLTAYALDFPNAIFLLAEHDALTKFKILQKLYTEKLRAGVAKGNAPLLAIINKGIKKISTAEIEELYSKWSINPPPLIVRYRNWIIGAIVVLLSGCIGFAFYIYRLKSRIRRIKSGNKSFNRDEWQKIIDQGENDWVEFKSSLRWNIQTEKPDKRIEEVIIKTLSAFMNARGGTLFIGINDEGRPVGIEADYKSFQRKPNRDGFLLKLSSMISQNLGRQSHKFIITDIQIMDGHDVCRITVKPGERPIYIKGNGKEFFYIRTGASSVPLSMSEAHEYINSQW